MKKPILKNEGLVIKSFEAHNLDLILLIAINILDLVNDDISKL